MYAVRNRIGISRNLLRALDHLRELEPADARHLDVEHDRRDVVIEQQRAARVSASVGAQEAVARIVEDRLERVEVSRLVVDEQDVDRVGIAVTGTARPAAATAAGRC